MWCHALDISRGAGQGRIIAPREWAGHQLVRKLHCVFLVLYILFISTIVVIVLFLCYSVKLSLSQPTNFTFFFWFFSPPGGEEQESNCMGLNHEIVAKAEYLSCRKEIKKLQMRKSQRQTWYWQLLGQSLLHLKNQTMSWLCKKYFWGIKPSPAQKTLIEGAKSNIVQTSASPDTQNLALDVRSQLWFILVYIAAWIIKLNCFNDFEFCISVFSGS